MLLGRALASRARAAAQACPRALALPLLQRTTGVVARSVGTKASNAAGQSIFELGQVDRGFFQGTAMLAAVMAGTQLVPVETQAEAIRRLAQGFRALGLRASCISDDVLVNDFLRKNALAAQNVLIASPTFYFLFAYITDQSLGVCAMRALTGTMRIVPFMFLFYGAFACLAPFATQWVMLSNNQTYEQAVTPANVGLMLGGFVFVEAVVELRGCGVTFAQMTLSSFLIFVPALVGRLAAGVLTQQSKVGQESPPLVPAEWAAGAEWQRAAHKVSRALCLDMDFLTTAAGTSVFQHVLNAVTFVLLTRGNKSTIGDIFRFLCFGVNNTLASGAAQTLRTFVMRTLFGLSWNMASSQPWETPAFDRAAAAASAQH